MTDRAVRRCTECGEPQKAVRRNVDYPESGLDNVQLINLPVWICANGHEELEIPAITELHELLARMIIRKPAPMTGPEVRFLRTRLDMMGKDFSARIGITPVQLSRLEQGRRRLHRRMDLLIRLSVAALMAARDVKPFPNDLAPLVEELEQSWDIGSHRIKHLDIPTPSNEWQQADA